MAALAAAKEGRAPQEGKVPKQPKRLRLPPDPSSTLLQGVYVPAAVGTGNWISVCAVSLTCSELLQAGSAALERGAR